MLHGWKATNSPAMHIAPSAFLSTVDTWRVWWQESESQAGHRTGLPFGSSGWQHATAIVPIVPPGILNVSTLRSVSKQSKCRCSGTKCRWCSDLGHLFPSRLGTRAWDHRNSKGKGNKTCKKKLYIIYIHIIIIIIITIMMMMMMIFNNNDNNNIIILYIIYIYTAIYCYICVHHIIFGHAWLLLVVAGR